jgi:tetratricopeptide (TPR) repeat protein
MGNTEGESSSKTTEIDLSPPADDAKEHPRSADAMDNAENPPDRGNVNVNEMHAWNPHKAAKDIEVGDFYFKRKNYRAAESRYREALDYKDNDADATYRLAICLEKLNQPDEAVAEFQSYLRILPHGSKAEDAQKAIERLSKPQSEKAAK